MKKSRSRATSCRNFQVNIKEEVRDVINWASGYYEEPLYKVVEKAILETYFEHYKLNKEN